ncbi:hypothetical protein EJ06DRAFT_534541 [Trichodelitschia bisporula]|uniref:Uncharacterized protein n=1 Tax=Trichodelitschia bisporula TaxID=703511 RepID=A0A6G1HJ29_9PEZI|nr:hypothetical protein EJ06DRAFT_534541 [Trichodelitschia bisporula]
MPSHTSETLQQLQTLLKDIEFQDELFRNAVDLYDDLTGDMRSDEALIYAKLRGAVLMHLRENVCQREYIQELISSFHNADVKLCFSREGMVRYHTEMLEFNEFMENNLGPT